MSISNKHWWTSSLNSKSIKTGVHKSTNNLDESHPPPLTPPQKVHVMLFFQRNKKRNIKRLKHKTFWWTSPQSINLPSVGKNNQSSTIFSRLVSFRLHAKSSSWLANICIFNSFIRCEYGSLFSQPCSALSDWSSVSSSYKQEHKYLLDFSQELDKLKGMQVESCQKPTKPQDLRLRKWTWSFSRIDELFVVSVWWQPCTWIRERGFA